MKLTKRGKNVLAIISIVIISLTVYLGSLTTSATKKDDIVSYTFYTVKSTDTLWSIAQAHTTNNKDIRKTLYEIQKLNDIEVDGLKAGMRIAIFK